MGFSPGVTAGAPFVYRYVARMWHAKFDVKNRASQMERRRAARYLTRTKGEGVQNCDLDLRRGAGDGERTRTISLGMSAGMALTSTTAGRQSQWLTVSIREAPSATYPSGT